MMRRQLKLLLLLVLCTSGTGQAQQESESKIAGIGSYLTLQRQGTPFEWRENGTFFRHRVPPKISPGFYLSKIQNRSKVLFGVNRINLTRHEEPVRLDTLADIFPAHGPVTTSFVLALFYSRLWKIY